ncbi:hypothetical protein B0H15DRAFT_931749 [Mycena belliarum]|uniref:DUF6699 domain-containing protein n=1 Tax=Mycena belliarum TaxID=1033014 RepID=A0AAD6XKP4_9AGAR|nr:hypothetical protein B0H15DRAFT_931749 [Mycena belliae]
MSKPFLYVPEASSSTPYDPNYYSPFIPPSPLPYTSPFHTPAKLQGESPNTFNPNSVLWPEDAAQYTSTYIAGWTPLAPRPRTASWQGPAPPPPPHSPFLQPHAPAHPTHVKAKSWGNTPAWLPAPGQPQIHPWLDADAPAQAQSFHFDLAPTMFAPLRAVTATQSVHVSPAELRAPALHPPRTALRILHPRLPFWPVDLALPPAAVAAPPIALGDVLAALHHALHARISAADWAGLSPKDVQRVTRAFAQRCRMEAVRGGGSQATLHEREAAVRGEGVKRVDFLCGKTVFRGLRRAPEDPEGVLRLVTA